MTSRLRVFREVLKSTMAECAVIQLELHSDCDPKMSAGDKKQWHLPSPHSNHVSVVTVASACLFALINMQRNPEWTIKIMWHQANAAPLVIFCHFLNNLLFNERSNFHRCEFKETCYECKLWMPKVRIHSLRSACGQRQPTLYQDNQAGVLVYATMWGHCWEGRKTLGQQGLFEGWDSVLW